MDNFNMLVLHAIMWRKRWRRKRRNMWVHPINIKDQISKYLATCIRIHSRMKRNPTFFFRMNIEQFYRLSQLVGEEIQKHSTNYRRAITPEERLAILWSTFYKVLQETKNGFWIVLQLPFFLISVMDSKIIYFYLAFISSIIYIYLYIYIERE